MSTKQLLQKTQKNKYDVEMVAYEHSEDVVKTSQSSVSYMTVEVKRRTKEDAK